jgi:hypothetical protein
MDVRIKFGRYDGQVRDVEPEAARAMLASGRAELPTAERDRQVNLPAPPEIAGEVKPAKRPRR